MLTLAGGIYDRGLSGKGSAWDEVECGEWASSTAVLEDLGLLQGASCVSALSYPFPNWSLCGCGGG